MRTLYESLLDDEDILMKNSDDILKIEEFKQWLKFKSDDIMWTHSIDKISLQNDKIVWKDGSIILSAKNESLPDDIYFGELDDLCLVDDSVVKKHIHQFNKCKLRTLNVYTDIKNLEFTLSVAYFLPETEKIKNIKFHLTPLLGFGIQCNKIELPKLEFIKELSFDNGTNVIVAGDDESFGKDVVNYVKKGIAKRRKEKPFQTLYQLEEYIMELVYEILPMDHIEKNWQGIKRIVFADRDGKWKNGRLMDVINASHLKPADFIIEKRNGEWVPIQRLFNKL